MVNMQCATIKLWMHLDVKHSRLRWSRIRLSFLSYLVCIYNKGVAWGFERGVTVCQSEGTHQIVLSLVPLVVGFLLRNLTKRGGGGGHEHPRIP